MLLDMIPARSEAEQPSAGSIYAEHKRSIAGIIFWQILLGCDVVKVKNNRGCYK